MAPTPNPLPTDLDQRNMIRVYPDRSEAKTAVFHFFARKLLDQHGFSMAAGPAPALDCLESLHFSIDLDCRLAQEVRR